MADWVHCNKCYKQPSPESSCAFQLTSCGHILCKKCYEYSNDICKKANRPLHCFCCSKGPIRVMCINSSMDKKTCQFFMDSGRLWQEKTAKISKICQFQSQQIQSLVRFARIREAEIKELKQKNQQLTTNLNELRQHKQQTQNRSHDPSFFRKPYPTSGHSGATTPNASFTSNHNNSTLQRSVCSNSGFRSSPSRGSHTSGSGIRLISLDSPRAFSLRAHSTTINSSMSSDGARSSSIPSVYQPAGVTASALKPTILASYSTTSSTSSRGSSGVSSAARAVLMPGRIAAGNIVPSTSKNLLHQQLPAGRMKY